jgi:RNA recognition motif-containing protein
MSKKLYVGNLSYTVDEDALRKMFSEAGTVESVKVITDRDTGRSRGFAFVEMASNEEATDAINRLNGAQLEGRSLTVSEARPQPPRERGGGRGDRGGFGGFRR